jgi:phosphatidylglycerol:prolipoprotein diacylglycerol transferase
MFLFYEGGLVVYGGIIGGMIATAIFFWRHRLSVLAMYDIMAPALLLGIAFGRLGCLMNGCCFGSVCEPAYGIVFPVGSPAHYSQVEHNDVFLGGLKFAPSETPNLSKDNNISADNKIFSTPNVSNRTAENVDFYSGGCSCYRIHKRNISKEEQERRDSLPAMISEVEPNSDAEKAGLKPNMIVRRLLIAQDNGQSYEVTGSHLFLNVSDLHRGLFELAINKMNKTKAELTFVVTTPENDVSQTIRYSMPPAEVLPVYPTQLISSIGAICLCFLILFLERIDNRDGFTSILFLFFYSIGRFHIELFRDDEASFLRTGLSVAQNVSIGIFLLGVIITIYIYTRPPRHALENRFEKQK